MNILFLMHRFIGFGGIEMVTKNLAIELNAKFGYNVSIFSILKQDTDESFFASKHYDFYIAKTEKKEELKKEFKEYLSKKSFDIVVFQDSYAKIEYLLDEVTLKKIPIITVEHNTPDCFLKSHKRLTAIISKKPKNIIRLIVRAFRYRLLKKEERKRRKVLLKRSDKYVLLSDNFKPILKKCYGIEDEKIISITNPIRTTNSSNCLEKQNIALFVGRLTKDKGVDNIIEIWTKLEPLLPEWKLKIVGEGEEKEYILKRIKELKLQRIELHNFTTDIGKYYNEASIYLMTSVFEGFGLVIAEAMSYGVIPFAFNSFESLYDIVEDEKDGYIINAFDTNEFVNSVENFINLPEDDKTTMRNNAVIKSKKFSFEAIVIEWNNLFNKILNKQ